MNSGDFIRILKSLPNTRLEIIELTWKLTRRNGQIDQDKSLEMIDELTAAQTQAKAYTEAAARMKICVTKLIQS